MKRTLFLASLLAAFQLGTAAGQPESKDRLTLNLRVPKATGQFDPKEPISLDLKDAKIEDVIATLGAIANLPVSIEPDVSGTVTVHMDNIPYDRALARISAMTGVLVRIEEGKLVASRSSKPVSGAAVLPEKFRGLPRLVSEDYSKSSPEALFVRTRWNSSETCNRLAGTTLIPAPPQTREFPLLVSQFGYEPVTGTRFVVVDGPLQRAFALRPGQAISAEVRNESNSVRVFFTTQPGAGAGCQDPDRKDSGVRPQRMVAFELRERLEDGTFRSVMRPRVGALAGVAFSLRSGSSDAGGRGRAFVIRGYLSRDGGSVAVALVAEATWIDPKDGREYIYAQVSDVSEYFVPFTRDWVAVTSLPAGVATDRPLELWVSLGTEKSGAAD